MAHICITNIQVQNNTATIMSPLSFLVTFECFKHIPGELKWQVLYLTSVKNVNTDQIVDEFSMTDLNPGVMQFTISSDHPNFSTLTLEDIVGKFFFILGTSALMICVSYEGQEFFRTGYYVVNELPNGVSLDMPHQNIRQEGIQRSIMSDNPRIMRYEIEWANYEGNSSFNANILEKNIQAVGGDPFQSCSNVLEKLQNSHISNNDQNNYRSMMFNS